MPVFTDLFWLVIPILNLIHNYNNFMELTEFLLNKVTAFFLFLILKTYKVDKYFTDNNRYRYICKVSIHKKTPNLYFINQGLYINEYL